MPVSPSRGHFGELVFPYKMDRWIGSTAVVTGASSGIGAAISETFIKHGINVVGVARGTDLMEKVAAKLQGENATFYPKKCDLLDEQQIYDVFDWIEENIGGISIMVNNAGLLLDTTLVDGDVELWKTQINLNVLALCICTKLAVASMRRHNLDGHVIHMNSISGHYLPVSPIPCTNVYPPSKHSVTALMESLRRELILIPQPKIKVTSISPGLVSTDLLDNFPETGGLRDAIKRAPCLSPFDVADNVVYVLGTPAHVQVHELMVKAWGESI